MNVNKIGIIGLGLIGGSLAKAIRSKKLHIEIIAYDTYESSLVMAKEENVIDYYCTTIDNSFYDLDIIFLCAPVMDNLDTLKQLKKYLSDDIILTDVGSVKQPIHKVIKKLNLDKCFIGGHPMAGSEKFGYVNSTDYLFENAFYVLTPCNNVSQSRIDKLSSLIEIIGAIPIIMNEKEHDFVTASISHIPHILASSLVNIVNQEDSHNKMKQLAAGGFKDLTRIASSNPKMWQQICLSNKESIIYMLNKYISNLKNFITELDNENFLIIYNFFEQAKAYRSELTDLSISLAKRTYEVMVDIKDETGAIAKIATVLSTNDINIKNIGIINNREDEQGILKIVFYDHQSQLASISILKNLNYIIYEH